MTAAPRKTGDSVGDENVRRQQFNDAFRASLPAPSCDEFVPPVDQPERDRTAVIRRLDERRRTVDADGKENDAPRPTEGLGTYESTRAIANAEMNSSIRQYEIRPGAAGRDLGRRFAP